MIHLATAALVNAVWDLYAKVEGKPLWKLLADLSPEQIVAGVDFRYIDDALTPAEALELLDATARPRAEREAQLRRRGLPGLHDVGRLARLRRGEARRSERRRRSRAGFAT